MFLTLLNYFRRILSVNDRFISKFKPVSRILYHKNIIKRISFKLKSNIIRFNEKTFTSVYKEKESLIKFKRKQYVITAKRSS